MSKKHFIALADAIREHNRGVAASIDADEAQMFGPEQLDTLADFCMRQNGNFKRERWLAYIVGECGKNGGQRKQTRASKPNAGLTALANHPGWRQ